MQAGHYPALSPYPIPVILTSYDRCWAVCWPLGPPAPLLVSVLSQWQKWRNINLYYLKLFTIFFHLRSIAIETKGAWERAVPVNIPAAMSAHFACNQIRSQRSLNKTICINNLAFSLLFKIGIHRTRHFIVLMHAIETNDWYYNFSWSFCGFEYGLIMD